MKKEGFAVTPWNVSGAVDYNKLSAQFGVELINKELLKRIQKHTGEGHFMLQRGIFFAHRDLSLALDAYEAGTPLFLYTGRAPSGPIHLGHLVSWVFTRWLQQKLGLELWFQFPDEEKFLFKQDLSFEQAQTFLKENMRDVLALGFNPQKTHFLIDTRHASLMYPEACKVAKKITFSMVKSSFGLTEQSNIGSIFYTAMQAVPSFLPSVISQKKQYCLIPHAIDQDPHFRLTRDIVPKLGYPKPASIQCKFLPPLTGVEGKMSSSTEQAIYLDDNPSEVKRKINKYAFSGGRDTLEEHRKYGGNPDKDISFTYLNMLLEPDDRAIARYEKDYRAGKLLSGELKAITIDKINEFLAEHQKRKKESAKLLEKVIFKG
jgi:tryptophanyl-tRNA synthetase